MPLEQTGARYADAGELIARAFGAMRIPERISVSESARRYRYLENPGGGYTGIWKDDETPHLVRPMDCLGAASPYWMVAVMGPGQSAKSSIGDNWLLHTVVTDPADFMFVGPDKNILQSYVTSQINKMIRTSPAMREKQMRHMSADNIFSKQFQGCTLHVVWPVGAQFRARPAPRARIDDYDALPQNIDGEGNAIMLLTTRATTFEGYEKIYVNSSPKLGRDLGIEAVVSGGTDERWFVQCPDCGEHSEFTFAAWVRYRKDGTPEQAKESAHYACPECGVVLEPRRKRELMQSGKWVAAGQTIDRNGTITGARKNTGVASFRIDGAAGFASPGKLAELERSATITFETTQDEGELRAFENTRIGRNYRSKVEGAEPIEPDALILRSEQSGYKLGEIPPGIRVLTAAIDVQGRSFECLVTGWGEGFSSALIDRFTISELADGRTAVDPANRPEDWAELLSRVIWRKYPLQSDPERTAPILSTAIDTGGADGVTKNAFEFFYTAMRVAVPPGGITLIKGGNDPKARLLPSPTIDVKHKTRRSDPDAELFVPNVSRFKDMIDIRLRRNAPGPGYIALPSDLPENRIIEITAEQKIDGAWIRKHAAANETWDLMIYNAVVMARHGGADGSLKWVPRAYRIDNNEIGASGSHAPGTGEALTENSPTDAPDPPAARSYPTPPADHPHARPHRRRRGIRGKVTI